MHVPRACPQSSTLRTMATTSATSDCPRPRCTSTSSTCACPSFGKHYDALGMSAGASASASARVSASASASASTNASASASTNAPALASHAPANSFAHFPLLLTRLSPIFANIPSRIHDGTCRLTRIHAQRLRLGMDPAARRAEAAAVADETSLFEHRCVCVWMCGCMCVCTRMRLCTSSFIRPFIHPKLHTLTHTHTHTHE